ncbi:MAG: efflux transporter, family, subunit [Segetibacter sp.]|nr:efflux transporter, family, subunit [Segetibacter sp.]
MRLFLNYKTAFFIGILIITLLVTSSCKQKKHEHVTTEVAENKPAYTCPMHPEIVKDKPGDCPICGMNLVAQVVNAQKVNSIELEDLLKPTNEFVITSVPVTTIQNQHVDIPIEAIGSIENDTKQTGAISARVAGRIERLYVRYRYQMIEPGQKIMEIYSPEVATSQQNLLFLLKNDPSNTSLIQAAKQRLLFFGMSNQQLNELIRTRKASLTISVFSTVMGHVHEAGQETMNQPGSMAATTSTTAPLSIREGMYVTAGQRIFSITDPYKARAILNIFPENQHMVKVGNTVKLTPEAMPHKAFRAKINFIEPFFREGNKTLTARVTFDNSELQIPIGSQVRADILGRSAEANWLPKDAVLSLGINQVAFVKTSGAFVARKIQTGMIQQNLVQVIGGLSVKDTVAANAQYLTDSESFVKVKQ